MTYSLSKTACYVFLFTAAVYLGLINSINFPVTTVLKPIPIICLLLAVLQTEIVLGSKLLLVNALLFSIAGDVVLTLPIHWELELGIGCFLVAHCFYISLCWRLFEFNLKAGGYFIVILSFMLWVAFIMIPYLGALFIPVLVYLGVLLSLVFSALQVKQGAIVIGSGALFFLISDLALAVNLFMYPELNMKVGIMFTYYVAQFLLVWGLVKEDSGL